MGNEAAHAACELGGEIGGEDRRRRGREYGCGRGELVELCKNLAFGVELLGNAFLNNIGARDGLCDRRHNRHAFAHRADILHQACSDQDIEPLCDQTCCRVARLGARIGQIHLPSGASKDDRP